MIATCATCGEQQPAPSTKAAAEWLWGHDDAEHRGVTPISQLPAVTFHHQALDAILSLALTGRRFTIGEAHPLVTVTPANPRTDWPKVQREAESNGWITHVGFDRSVVPGTKGSAVSVWQGTAEARRHAQRRAA